MNYGVCLEMFFTDRPFLERIGLVADAGYRFAEMWFVDGTFDGGDVHNGDPKDPDKVWQAAEKAGVTLTNAVIGSPDGSLGGGLTSPDNRDQWLKRTDETFTFCKEAGIGAVIVCTGNIIPGQSREAMRQSVLDGLKATADRAEKAGMDLFLEPLNDEVDHPDYFCVSSDEGAALCREVGSPRMKLLFDCYHMQVMEGNLVAHIERNMDVIGHFHSAGVPGRHELVAGETDYPFVIGKIEELGYGGVFALEYMPLLEPGASLKQTLQYLNGQ